MTPRQQLVMDYLATHGPSSAAEVGRAIGCEYTKAYDALTSLYTKGLIDRQHSLVNTAGPLYSVGEAAQAVAVEEGL